MTDESKPKVVEQWMREACENANRELYYAGKSDFDQEDVTHGESRPGCVCDIIASAFARSRPAVAAEHRKWCPLAEPCICAAPAPPSSDPAPGYEQPMDMMPFKAPAPRETAGAVASEAAHAAASGDNVAGLLDADELEQIGKSVCFTRERYEQQEDFEWTAPVEDQLKFFAFLRGIEAKIARLRAAAKGGA